MYQDECPCPSNTLKELKVVEKKINPPPKKKKIEEMFLISKKKCPKGKKDNNTNIYNQF